nr:MAG TPA: hypothetical protein [Caudoviricetes sp.]
MPYNGSSDRVVTIPVVLSSELPVIQFSRYTAPRTFSHVLGNYASSVWPSRFGRTNCSDRKPMFWNGKV